MQRQLATANSRNFLSLALPRRNSSVRTGSVQASHSASSTVFNSLARPPRNLSDCQRNAKGTVTSRPAEDSQRAVHSPPAAWEPDCREWFYQINTKVEEWTRLLLECLPHFCP